MTDNQNIEKNVKNAGNKMTLSERVIDGLGAIPPIIGCTAAAYLLEFSGCIDQVSEYLPAEGLNLGFHLAAGSGLYGGFTNNTNRKIASIVTLAGSFAPEIALVSQDGDFTNVGTASAAKLIGYGLGYIVGYLFSSKN